MFFSRSKSLTPADALTALTGGELQLVDVREPAELARGGIKGATHIPLGRLQGKLAGLDRGRPVAFICQSGARSARANPCCRQGRV
jgi:rhodanese-related sulfurtransferase